MLDDYLLGDRNKRRIDAFCAKFEQPDLITYALDSDTMPISSVCLLLHAAICEYPTTKFCLDSHAQIVHQPDFESAISMIQDHKVGLLTKEERFYVMIWANSKLQKDLTET